MRLTIIKTEGEIRAAMLAPTPGRRRIELTTEGSTIKDVRVGQCHFQPGDYSSGVKVLCETGHRTASRLPMHLMT